MKRFVGRPIIILLVEAIILTRGAWGQAEPSENFIVATRNLATSGHRNEALHRLDERLAQKPGDIDVRLLRGIVLSWQGRYEDAREDLKLVIAEHPSYGDAVLALINVELWSGNPEAAERIAVQALEHDPLNGDFAIARARALRALNRTRQAHAILAKLVSAEPNNKPAREAFQNSEDAPNWEAKLSHTQEWFSDGRTPWREEQFQLKRAFPIGSVFARFSHAERFSLRSRLMELDWYPHIRSGTYGYLNFGYSADSVLYPRFRVGADLYQSLGRGFEGSAGFRQLRFSSKVNIYTGALSKYHGKWLVTGRTYLTPDQVGTSHSIHIIARRYFGAPEDYWSVRGGWGSSPFDFHTLTDVGILESHSFSAELNRHIARRTSINIRGGIGQEDRIERSGLYRYWLDAGLFFGF
jgi:YaiO family outer membrane protein